MKINGKVALVTGSARRVGRAIALTLAAKGARVMVHYHKSSGDARETLKLIKLNGGQGDSVRGDLSRCQDAKNIVLQTVKRFGGIDILVNSASVYLRTPLGTIRERDWDRHIDTNLKAIFFSSQEAARYMLKQKSGKIVNIIDSDVTQPYKHYLPYLVSKSGLVGLTYSLAKELAPHIQVNAISPGPVVLPEGWGPKIRKAIIEATPLRRIGDPQDIANAVAFCIEGTDFMTGAIIPVDGGQHIE